MKTKGPIKNLLTRLAINHARRSAVQNLVNDGVDPRVAENHVAAVEDNDIEDYVKQEKMKFETVGSGGVLQWLQDHMDQILSIVKFIMSIVAMFAATSLKTPKMSAMLAGQCKPCDKSEARNGSETPNEEEDKP